MVLGRVTNIMCGPRAQDISWKLMIWHNHIIRSTGKNLCVTMLQQFGETGSAMVTTANILPSGRTILFLNPRIKAIVIYTFVVVMWETFKHQLLVGYPVIRLSALSSPFSSYLS